MTEVYDPDIDLGNLSTWLAAEGLPSDITAASRLGGGTQNIVLGLTIGGGEYVLRHPPAHPRPHSNRAIAREMRVLQALRDTDVPHPAFIAGVEGYEELGGATFYLMEAVDGFNPSGKIPQTYLGKPEWVRSACMSVATSLAGLGSLVPADIGLGDLDRSDGFLERQVANSVSLWRKMGDTPGYDPTQLGEIDSLVDWLNADVPQRGAPGITHGDFQLNNVLLANDRPELGAIIDWEMCTIGDPLLDLGWLLICWPGVESSQLRSGGELSRIGGIPSRAEILDAYAQHTERDLSRIDWYSGLAFLKLGILLETTYVRALEGNASKSTGDYLHTLAVDLISTGRQLAAGHWDPYV